MHPLRVAFLASNNGNSFRAIADEIRAGSVSATAVLLVSNKSNAPALDYARVHDIPCMHIATQGLEDVADQMLCAALDGAGVELVVLSGYLRKLGPLTLSAYEGRILNVHPALLPKYGGKGMYGRAVHQAVLDNHDRVTGATIHVVDGEYDHGRIVAAAQVPVEAGDDVESLERRVMQAECALFIETIRKLASRELQLPFQPI